MQQEQSAGPQLLFPESTDHSSATPQAMLAFFASHIMHSQHAGGVQWSQQVIVAVESLAWQHMCSFLTPGLRSQFSCLAGRAV